MCYVLDERNPKGRGKLYETARVYRPYCRRNGVAVVCRLPARECASYTANRIVDLGARLEIDRRVRAGAPGLRLAQRREYYNRVPLRGRSSRALAHLGAELVDLKVDLIFASSTRDARGQGGNEKHSDRICRAW